MNIITTQRYVFLLLIALYCNSIGAVTLSGQNINDIAKPGDGLTYENVDSDHIAFKINNGDLSAGSTVVEGQQKIYDRFIQFCNEQHGSMRVKRLDLVGSSQFLEGQYIYSDDEMVINSAKTFSVNEAVLKANSVYLATDKIQCSQCFIDSDELTIQTHSAAAICAIVRFTRDKNNKNPMVITGSMDFVNSNPDDLLIVLGAKNMTVVFSDQAFSKK